MGLHGVCVLCFDGSGEAGLRSTYLVCRVTRPAYRGEGGEEVAAFGGSGKYAPQQHENGICWNAIPDPKSKVFIHLRVFFLSSLKTIAEKLFN